MTAFRAGIALGSNLGDRMGNLQRAAALLASISDEPIIRAPVYLTEPVNCPPESPDFLNTVVEISYKGTAMELLAQTQKFQHQLGRTEATERNAPRVIDIDLLYFDSDLLTTNELILPHPRLTQRQFVLRPLATIRPDLILPGDVLMISEHLKNLREEPLRVVTKTW